MCPVNPGPLTLLSALLPSVNSSPFVEFLLRLDPIEDVQLRGQLSSAISELELHHFGVFPMDTGGQMFCEQVGVVHRSIDLDQRHYLLNDLLLQPQNVDVNVANVGYNLALKDALRGCGMKV